MTYRKTLILAGMALVASLGIARAEDDTQVWRAANSQKVIHNTWGQCVRSRWMTDTDACGSNLADTSHTVIAEADRTVYFEFNKAILTDEAQALLNSLADKLKAADDVQGAKVVGFADRIGTVSYNEKLSKKRAEAVRDYLVGQGVLNASVTKTRWVGKSEPTAQCSTSMKREQLIDCLQPDRKVEVDIVYRSTKTTSGQKMHHHKSPKKMAPEPKPAQ